MKRDLQQTAKNHWFPVYNELHVDYIRILNCNFFPFSLESESWPLILSAELRLRVNEEMVPRKKFVVKN